MKKVIVGITVIYLVGILFKVAASFMSPVTFSTNEYSYLKDYVKGDKLWTEKEFANFVGHLNDKHLLDLAIMLKIDKSTVAEVIGYTEFDINSFLGLKEDKEKGEVDNSSVAKTIVLDVHERSRLLREVKRDIVYDYSNNMTYLFKDKEVPLHTYVKWLANDMGVNDEKLEKCTTIELERELIRKSFENTWDKMNKEQREAILKDKNVKAVVDGLTAEEKMQILAASGTVAFATLSATISLTGFTFYTTMSSFMASAAGAVGVTLPFSVYTGASTTAGVLSGPIGWTCIAIATTGTSIWAMGTDEDALLNDIMVIHALKAKALAG